MDIRLRSGSGADAEVCGKICYEAFKDIGEQHNFPSGFSSPAELQGLLSMLFALPHVHSVVAEVDGQLVGSNFLWKEALVAGVGPITVALDVQSKSIGRLLMEDVLEHAREQGFASVRLVQAAYNRRSLSLYTKLGFDVIEPLVVLKGPALQLELPGHRVRPATESDLPGCNALCQRVHGLDRAVELQGAIQQGTATVVESAGRITGYASSVSFFGHAVAENNEALQSLIAATPSFDPQGFLLPTRNSELFRWCLAHGLRVTEPMTLMSTGLYKQPAGAFLPSILF